MLESNDLSAIDKAFPRIRAIWIAMLAFLGVYVIIVNLLGPILGWMPIGSDTSDPATAKYGYGLYGIAVAELIVAFFFHRSLVAGKDGKERASDRLDSFLGTPAASDGMGGVREAITVYRSGMLLCLGLSEAVALCGLMGFLVRTDYLQFYLLAAISLAALMYFRPKKEEMVAVADRLLEESGRRRSP